MPKKREPKPQPFMEFRVGGVHLVVQRPPVRLLSAVVTLVSTALATYGLHAHWWLVG